MPCELTPLFAGVPPPSGGDRGGTDPEEEQQDGGDARTAGHGPSRTTEIQSR